MKPKKALSIFAFVMVISIIITSCHGGGTTIPDGDEPQTAASDFNAEQAVTQLGFESFPDIPTLMPVGDGRVLSSYFDGESGYRLALCDIRSGKTLRDSKMKYWVSPCQPIDETNALVEIGEDFYSLDLNSFETERINVPEPFGVFNEGMSEYYYSKADTLYCKNLKSGEAFAIENEYGVGVSTVENVYSGGILSVLATTLTSAGKRFRRPLTHAAENFFRWAAVLTR